MCPGVNKPVTLAAGSYLIEKRAEGWRLGHFMALPETLVKETGATGQL